LRRHAVTSEQSLQITEWPHKLLDLVEAYGLKAALQADTD
jgi:ABC-type transporter Mla MlaB component